MTEHNPFDACLMTKTPVKKKLKKFEYDNKNVDSIDCKNCEKLFENDNDDVFEMFLDVQKMKIMKKTIFF